jgi:hypothetical protein
MRHPTVFAASLLFAASFVTASFFTPSAFAADPELMNLVMPDAKILAGANATTTKISPLGQFVLSKITLLGEEPQKFIAATGFDPLKDVSEVLAATAADPASHSGLLLVRGTFNVDKISGVIAGHHEVQTQSYGGATLFSLTNRKTNATQALAFIGSTIAVAGDLATVKAAIDRSTGANSIDPALALQVNQLSQNEDEWVVSSASIASLMPATATAGSGPAAQVMSILKSIQTFTGGVKFGSDVQITAHAVADTAQNAAALAAVVKLGVNLASMNSGKGAQLTELARLLQNLQVTASGSDLNLALAIPETQVEALLNQVLKPSADVQPASHRWRQASNGN